MFKNPNEYVASIEQGRAYRYTSYHTNSVSVELSIRAKDMDSAYYLILCNCSPG